MWDDGYTEGGDASAEPWGDGAASAAADPYGSDAAPAAADAPTPSASASSSGVPTMASHLVSRKGKTKKGKSKKGKGEKGVGKVRKGRVVRHIGRAEPSRPSVAAPMTPPERAAAPVSLRGSVARMRPRPAPPRSPMRPRPPAEGPPLRLMRPVSPKPAGASGPGYFRVPPAARPQPVTPVVQPKPKPRGLQPGYKPSGAVPMVPRPPLGPPPPKAGPAVEPKAPMMVEVLYVSDIYYISIHSWSYGLFCKYNYNSYCSDYSEL